MFINKKGLTLIELLAVIAIIAILFVLLIPQVNNAINKARETGIMTDFSSYEKNFYSFMLTNEKNYSPLDGSINSVLSKELQFKGLVSIKKNPFGEHYYLKNNIKDRISISTWGKDKLYTLTLDFNDGELVINKEGFGNDSIEVAISVSPNVSEEDFEYTVLENGTVRIDSYIGKKRNINIPSILEGKPVEVIAESAFTPFSFDKETSLTSVILPEGLKNISPNAFRRNNLTYVKIPSSLENINFGAFTGNEKITFEVSSDNPYFKHGENNLGIFTKDGTGLVLGDARTFSTKDIESINVIKAFAFAYQMLNGEITIPNNITTIETHAFVENSVDKFNIGGGVSQIAHSSFGINHNAKFNVSDGNTNFKHGINNLGLYSKDGLVLVQGTKEVISTDEFLNVTVIGDYAFRGIVIDDLVLHEGITTLGSASFYQSDLKKLKIPNSLTTIHPSALLQNNNLKQVINCSNIDVNDYQYLTVLTNVSDDGC